MFKFFFYIYLSMYIYLLEPLPPKTSPPNQVHYLSPFFEKTSFYPRSPIIIIVIIQQSGCCSDKINPLPKHKFSQHHLNPTSTEPKKKKERWKLVAIPSFPISKKKKLAKTKSAELKLLLLPLPL